MCHGDVSGLADQVPDDSQAAKEDAGSQADRSSQCGELTRPGFRVKTLVDPLYEPLRFRQYEWCECLELLGGQRLGQWGLTPYVLLDAERFEQVAGALGLGIPDEVQEVRSAVERYLAILQPVSSPAQSSAGEPSSSKVARSDLEEAVSDARRSHRVLLEKGQKVINSALYPDGRMAEDSFALVSRFFDLERVFRVRCPRCGDIVGMSEYTRIFAIVRNLQSAFEGRRCRWLMQAGALHSVLQSATHTRHAHMIGTVVAAVNALLNMAIYPSGDVSMQLGKYFLARGFLREFVAAAFVHDLGHPPLSHVLERNPFVPLDHEEITRSLVRGAPDAAGKTSWYALSQYLQRLRVVSLMNHEDQKSFFTDAPKDLTESCDIGI